MAVTAIADDDSEFPVCLTGLISICMHVCVGLVCSVEPAVESHAEQPPLQLHWHCAERHRPLASAAIPIWLAITIAPARSCGILHLQPRVDPEQVAGSADRDGPLHVRNSDGA